jgi:phosphohistidine phosphatase
MVTLLILRHAKSDWDNPKLGDFDRPLSARGRRDAPRMGTYISAHAPPLDAVLCSAAVRTRETWALVSNELLSKPEVSFARELYLADPDTLLDHILKAPATCKTLMLVGHNPGLHALAQALVNSKAPAALRDALDRKFPTAALAILQFRAKSWTTIRPASGLLTAYVTPKSLKAGA